MSAEQTTVDDVALPGRATATSLELPSTLTLDDWERAGVWLGQVARACQWWIGDWLNHGERNYGDVARKATAITGYAKASLYTFVGVARGVKPAHRRPELSFGHHALVAYLDSSEQVRWLKHAVDGDWTIAEFRRHLRTGKIEARATSAAKERGSSGGYSPKSGPGLLRARYQEVERLRAGETGRPLREALFELAAVAVREAEDLSGDDDWGAEYIDPSEGRWLDGPGFVAWMSRHMNGAPIEEAFGTTPARRWNRWMHGEVVNVDHADELVLKVGKQLWEVPDEVWIG